MALVVENGSGVFGANSYIAASYVTAYLAERNRAGEGGWTTPEDSEEDAACIAATDHIELRFRSLFAGTKEHRSISVARATWTATQQPAAGETVTVGAVVYTFQSTLSAAGDVLIGASISASIDNLAAAINSTPSGAGVTHHADTVENEDATALAFIDDSLVAFAKASGTAGNEVDVATDVTGASWNFATLIGGSDIQRAQPLSFPRRDLFDRDGIPIIGIPDRLKFATAEYAVRARAATLITDPTADSFGGVITSLREKVGPIETATEYLPGTAGIGRLPDYPAADRVLREYLRPSGVIRG